MSDIGFSYKVADTTADVDYGPQYYVYWGMIAIFIGLLQFHNLRTWQYVAKGDITYVKGQMDDEKDTTTKKFMSEFTTVTENEKGQKITKFQQKMEESAFGAAALLVPTLTLLFEIVVSSVGWGQYGVMLNNGANATANPGGVWQGEFQWPKDVLALLITIAGLVALGIYYIAIVLKYVGYSQAVLAYTVNLANTVFLFGYVVLMTCIGFMYPVPEVWDTFKLDFFLASGIGIAAFLMFQLLHVDTMPELEDGEKSLGYIYLMLKGIVGIFVNIVRGMVTWDFEDLIQTVNEMDYESTKFINRKNKNPLARYGNLPTGMSPVNGVGYLPYGSRYMNVVGCVPLQYFSDAMLMAIITFSYSGLLIIYGDQLQATGIFLTTTLAAYLTSVLAGGNEYFASYFTVYNVIIFGMPYFWSGLGWNDTNYDLNNQVNLLNREPGVMDFGTTVSVMIILTVGSIAAMMVGFKGDRGKTFLGAKDRFNNRDKLK